MSRPLGSSTPAIERVLNRIEINPYNGCWIFTGKAGTPQGYGQVSKQCEDGKTRPDYVHRVSFEHFVRPLLPGEEVDHVCKHPRCVNPDHLEAVSRHTNWERSNCPSAVNARKTHCQNGHPLSGENLLQERDGHRRCRECIRQWEERRKQPRPVGPISLPPTSTAVAL